MADWVTEVIDGVNMIITGITDLFPSIQAFFISFLLALYYPVSIVIFVIQTTVVTLYNSFIPVINAIITIGNFPIILLESVFVIPSPWTTILYIMLIIVVMIKSIRWIRTIPIIGKYIFATGDK